MEPEPSTSNSNAAPIWFPCPIIHRQASGSGDAAVPPQQERTRVMGTQDLVGQYGIMPLYEEFVRPFSKVARPTSAVAGKDAKGKGKAVEFGGVSEAKAEPVVEEKQRRIERNYSHLVADLPGTYSNARDINMQSLIGHPDYQHVDILPFDDQTLRDSFTLQPGHIENWEAIVAGPQETKSKKKKKKKRPNESVDLTNQQPLHAQNGLQPPAGSIDPTLEGEPSKKKRKKRGDVAIRPS